MPKPGWMRLRLATPLVLLVAALAVPAPASALSIGIGDQKPDMFYDPLFRDLELRYARIAVSWDAMNHAWERREIDAWMEGARAAGVRPLVGFWHSRTHRRRVPTPEQFRHQFREFRERYPWVRDYATWNEANHCGEPVCHRPRLVASYWRALRRECKSCRILAAEVLDMPNMAAWVRGFLSATKGHQPRYWGLHNYLDANRFRTSGTKALLRLTTGKVWFTETGGIVDRRKNARVPLPESPAHAAAATRWVFDRLVPLSGRITRVYLYHWNQPRGTFAWDSALINRYGRPRPAFRVLRREMALQAAARKAGKKKS